MMLFILTVIYITIVHIQAQTCSVTTTPILNGICPPGYIVLSSGCCPAGNVIGGPSTSGSCFDRVNPVTGQSDCPRLKSYCTNAVYCELMRQQCPLTCGFCSSGTCFDRVSPVTGKSDCPSLQAYCRNSAYAALMRQQCPKTCGYCT